MNVERDNECDNDESHEEDHRCNDINERNERRRNKGTQDATFSWESNINEPETGNKKNNSASNVDDTEAPFEDLTIPTASTKSESGKSM